MDTFNFSFFEDKPENASHSEANGTAPAEPPVPASTSSAEESDPFAFDDFDFTGEEAQSEPATSPAAPEHHLDLESPSHSSSSFSLDNGEFAELTMPPAPEAPAEEDFALDLPSSVVEELPLESSAPAPQMLAAPVEPPSGAPSEPESPSPQAASSTAPRIKAEPAKAARFLTQDNPWDEVAPRRERLRVAVLGASGIGFNHARWLAKHGGEVVAFLGSGEDSISTTGERLESLLGQPVPGFSDLEKLLSQTNPQAVCIASPPGLHFAQALLCLEADAHVLCEKPLVYFPNRSKRENRDGARELLKTATQRNLVLATQLQYGAATPILCRLAGVSPFEVGDFAMEIETTNPNSPRNPKDLWVDLGPHPLSIAQFLGGENGELMEETVQVVPSETAAASEVSARFGVRCEGGRLLMCRAIVRRFNPGTRPTRRRFSFNGRVVQYSGVKAPDKSYVAQYTAPDGYISHYPDPVDFLVGNFVRTCWGDDQLVLAPTQGVKNLDWLLSISDKISAN